VPPVIDTVLEALTSSEFLSGLFAGAAGVTAGLAGAISWRRSRRVLGLAGLLWTAACLSVLEGATAPLILGVALLAIGGTIHGRMEGIPWLRALAAVPGAWLIAQSNEVVVPGWVPWLAFGIVALGAPLMATGLNHLRPPGLAIGLWTITVGGVYATIPDTEELLVLAGAALALVILIPFRFVSFGHAGSYPALGLLAWATAVGGAGRPASIVGGLACVGASCLVPLAHALRPSLNFRWVRVVGVHLLVVLVCSRVAGLRSSVLEAAMLVFGAYVLGFLLLQGRETTAVQGPV
jgi:hypothetical protein